MAKSLNEIFDLLKNEAGPNGAIILMRAKGGPGEAMKILTDGQIHSVMGLLSIGSPWVQDKLNQKLQELLGDKKE